MSYPCHNGVCHEKSFPLTRQVKCESAPHPSSSYVAPLAPHHEHIMKFTATAGGRSASFRFYALLFLTDLMGRLRTSCCCVFTSQGNAIVSAPVSPLGVSISRYINVHVGPLKRRKKTFRLCNYQQVFFVILLKTTASSMQHSVPPAVAIATPSLLSEHRGLSSPSHHGYLQAD